MRKLFSVLSSTLHGGVRRGLLLLALFASVSAIYASDTQVDGIWYDFDSSTKTASVTYRGSSSFSYEDEYSGSVVIPETVTYNGTTYSVTSIGDEAFGYCSSLTSITIPNSVTSIGDGAFVGCDALPVENNLRYADTYLIGAVDETLSTCSIKEGTKWVGNNAFYHCSSLTSITIPNSVTSFGDEAFSYCFSLTSITIPNSVTSIGRDAFYGCYSLPVEDNLRYADTYLIGAVDETLSTCSIKEGTKWVGEYAFNGCSSLTSVTIPNSVTSIGYDAFGGCTSLTKTNYTGDIAGWCNIRFGSYHANPMYCSHNFYINDQEIKDLVIPNSVTCIGENAFNGCSSLTSVTIGNSVTCIGEYAFNGCSSLTSVTIPNSVTSIGEFAFEGCFELTKTNYTGDIAGWCNIKFGSNNANPMYCSHNFYINDQEIKDLVIPNSVTSIGGSAFYGCSSLTSVTIPNSVTSIGFSAFNNCSSLTSVTIPNSVTSIGHYAFDGCSSLTSVTIPNSVTSIGNNAFSDCTSLSSITIPNSVTSIESHTFYGCSSLTSVTIGNSVTSIRSEAFYGCTAIESIVWNAKNYANPTNKEIAPFYDIRSQIKSFTIGEAVEHIPAYLCYGMDKLTSVATPNSLNTIGTSAFEGCIRLNKISLGTGLEEIAANAFAGCTRLYDIYVYATYPPFAEESSFANYNVYVYVPCEYQRDYTLDIVWGKFKFIECLGAESEPVAPDTVIVTPGSTEVTITWPIEDGADTYTIVIKKDGEIFCTLTFNADGQLLNIAFAPSRDGDNRPAQYADQAVNGYRFTVTGLTEATQYAYSVTTKDAANKTIATYSGEFTTKGGTTTDVDNIQSPMTNCQKILRNGQLLILRDGVEYNAMGQEL